jgi:hypothetical protein
MSNKIIYIFSAMLLFNFVELKAQKQKEYQSQIIVNKDYFLGEWQIGADKHYIMTISKDSIAYFYRKKVIKEVAYDLIISDSIVNYKIDNNTALYCMREGGGIDSLIVIRYYDEYGSNDIVIIYLNLTGMDVIENIRGCALSKKW